MKKHLLLFILFISTWFAATAQTDTTKKVVAKVDSVKKAVTPAPTPEPPKPKKEIIVTIQESNESITGTEPASLKTTIFVDFKTVSNEWEDFLKKYDKKTTSPKGNKNTFLANAALIPTISYMPTQVTSKVINNGTGSATVIWAIKLDTGYVTKPKHPSFQAAKDLLHDFGVKVYQNNIKDQIKDAEKTFSKLQNQYEKQVREGQSLIKDVERNKKEKINLEQQIAENKKDSARFVTEIPNRLQDKDLALSAFNVRKTQFDSLKVSQALGKSTSDEVKKGDKELKSFEKETNKKVNAYEKSVKDAQKNKEEKQTLFRKLSENAVELPKLYSQIEQNKKEQVQANEAVKKQQLVVDTLKERIYLVK